MLLEVQSLLLAISVHLPQLESPFTRTLSAEMETPQKLPESFAKMSWNRRSDASLWDVREFVREHIDNIKLRQKYESMDTTQVNLTKLMTLPIWEPPSRYQMSPSDVPPFELESDGEEESDGDTRKIAPSTSSSEDVSGTSLRETKKARRETGSTKDRQKRISLDAIRDKVTNEPPIEYLTECQRLSEPAEDGFPMSFREFPRLPNLSDPEIRRAADEVRHIAADWLKSTHQRLLSLALIRTDEVMSSHRFPKLRNELFPTRTPYWIERHGGSHWMLFDTRPRFILRHAPNNDPSALRRYYTFLSNSPLLTTAQRFALARMLHFNDIVPGMIVSASLTPLQALPLVDHHIVKFKGFVPTLPAPRILDLDLMSQLLFLSQSANEEFQQLLTLSLDSSSTTLVPTAADVGDHSDFSSHSCYIF